jgi:hypothetical protein
MFDIKVIESSCKAYSEHRQTKSRAAFLLIFEPFQWLIALLNGP